MIEGRKPTMILTGNKADGITSQAIYTHSLLTVSELELSGELDGHTLLQSAQQKRSEAGADILTRVAQLSPPNTRAQQTSSCPKCQSVLEADD